MYGKIVENRVEIVYELPREIVVDDRRIFNPTAEMCGLVELITPEEKPGFVWHWGIEDGQIVPVYEEIPEPEVVEEEVVEEEPIAE